MTDIRELLKRARAQLVPSEWPVDWGIGPLCEEIDAALAAPSDEPGQPTDVPMRDGCVPVRKSALLEAGAGDDRGGQRADAHQVPTDRPSGETAMSEALERVIAEQQKEIDRLRLMEKNNADRWQHENKSVERMALAAFSVLNHPESPECHFELKQAVMAMGFCPRCEWRPCECECQYVD